MLPYARHDRFFSPRWRGHRAGFDSHGRVDALNRALGAMRERRARGDCRTDVRQLSDMEAENDPAVVAAEQRVEKRRGGPRPSSVVEKDARAPATAPSPPNVYQIAAAAMTRATAEDRGALRSDRALLPPGQLHGRSVEVAQRYM